MNNWFADIESKTFTIVKTRMLKKHKSKYPKLELTSDEYNHTPKNFPTIYIHAINLPEYKASRTFDNKDIRMVNASFEVEVITNTSKNDCWKLSTYAIEEMKELAFTMNQQSPVMVDGDLFRCVTRYSGLLDVRMFDR